MGEKHQTAGKNPEATRTNAVSGKPSAVPSHAASSPVAQVLLLQKTIGNQAVQRIFHSGALQAKLQIGQPNDKFEQEADRIADEVMRMPEPAIQLKPTCPLANYSSCGDEVSVQAKPFISRITPLVQRQPSEEEAEDEEFIQAKTTGEVPAAAPPTIISSSFQLLPDGEQSLLSESECSFVESRYSVDLSTLRIHNNTTATRAPRAVNAHAFKLGNNVVSGAGKYSSDALTRGISPLNFLSAQTKPVIQKQENDELLKKPMTQKSEDVNSYASSDITNRINTTKERGAPLSNTTRIFMENRFAADFGDVTIHDDDSSAHLNRQLHSLAFTRGKDIYFNQGKYNPATYEGKHLLAHELTHVVQQNNNLQGKKSGSTVKTVLSSGECISLTPGFDQTMNLNRNFRYTGTGVPLSDQDFQPEMTQTIEQWYTGNLRVVRDDTDSRRIIPQIMARFRQALRDLGGMLGIRRNDSVNFRAQVRIWESGIEVGHIRINGNPWAPRAAPPPETRSGRFQLNSELQGWWQALMISCQSREIDGSELFLITFRNRRGQPLDLVSWQRRSIVPATRHSTRSIPAPSALGDDLRANLYMSFQLSTPPVNELRMFTISRERGNWEFISNVPVVRRPPSRQGDQVILNRRELYGRIFQQWLVNLEEVSVRVAGIVAEEFIWFIVGGTIFRLLGGVLVRLPILRRLLSLRRMRELWDGVSRLGRRDADDLARYLRRIRGGGRLNAAETRRIEEIAVRLEQQLARRAVASTMNRQQMRAFLRQTWSNNPILRSVADAQRLSGQAQQRELINILTRFERETGVAVQFVPEGVVQAARGARNFASLRSSPGVLQVERQVLRDTPTLMSEVKHEMSFYYSSMSGRVPRMGDTQFNGLNLLEMMIEGGGSLPPPLL